MRGILCGVAVLALFASRSAVADAILIDGSVTTPQSVNDASLGGTIVTADGNTYAGTSVYNLISAAGIEAPAQLNGNPNSDLLDYIVVTGANNQSVVLSEGEVDPGFGGSTNVDIIANMENGKPITPQLIVPGDVNGGIGGRDIGGIGTITVGEASPAPGALTNAPSTQFTITGAAPTSTTYTSLSGFPQTAETVSYISGSPPAASHSFSGVPIFTLLQNAGLAPDPEDPSAILDDYIVATATDGYAVVYSLGELDPTYDVNPDGPPLVAVVSGSSGEFRSTAPGDVKGGRYNSNLESLNLVNAVPEPGSISLLAAGLLSLALMKRRRRA
jgi:hypothetical protein